MTELDELIMNRDNAYESYAISGAIVDKAKYNRAMSLLKSYITENNIDYEPIDLFDNEPVIINKTNEIDRTLDIDDIDDSPNLVDSFEAVVTTKLD